MKCPKCAGYLHTVDRRGVHLDQCDTCRGIFLDHGELEQILRAEDAYYGGAMPARGGRYPDSPAPYRGGHHDSPGPYRGAHTGHRYPDSPAPYRRHGKKGFLGELFG